MNAETYLVREEQQLEAIECLTTVRDFVRWGATQFENADLFFGHGTTNAWDESSYLVLWALCMGPQEYANVLDCKVTTSEAEEIVSVIVERANERKPAAYITNEMWFAGIPFYVDERVLVPRSPIAELIEQRFEAWLEPSKVKRVLDIGTGGGCIACACALAFPLADVDAVDLSPDALAVAEINVEQHDLEERVHLIHSDLFGSVGSQKYQLIISNPPYVAPEIMEIIPDEYRHEPSSGLVAAADGLEFAVPILKQASKHLSDEGILILEVGSAKEALMNRFPEVPFHWVEFKRGGSGVCMLTASQLLQYFA